MMTFGQLDFAIILDEKDELAFIETHPPPLIDGLKNM